MYHHNKLGQDMKQIKVLSRKKEINRKGSSNLLISKKEDILKHDTMKNHMNDIKHHKGIKKESSIPISIKKCSNKVIIVFLKHNHNMTKINTTFKEINRLFRKSSFESVKPSIHLAIKVLFKKKLALVSKFNGGALIFSPKR